MYEPDLEQVTLSFVGDVNLDMYCNGTKVYYQALHHRQRDGI